MNMANKLAAIIVTVINVELMDMCVLLILNYYIGHEKVFSAMPLLEHRCNSLKSVLTYDF